MLLGSATHAGHPSSQFGYSETPCVCKFDWCFVLKFRLTTSLAHLTRSPEKRIFHHCVPCCAFGVSFQFFSVTRLAPSKRKGVQADFSHATFSFDGATYSGKPRLMSSLNLCDLLARIFFSHLLRMG